jgi:hypothetical protein
MELQKQIEELQAKASKYENLREMFFQYNEQIQNAITLLEEVQRQIAPFLAPGLIITSQSNGNGRKKLRFYVDELYAKLNSGITITTALVLQTYQDLNQSQAHAIMALLEKQPNTTKTKDGVTVRLYAKKEV